MDVTSTQVAMTWDKELIANIPMDRDIHDVANTAPGVITEGVMPEAALCLRLNRMISGDTILLLEISVSLIWPQKPQG